MKGIALILAVLIFSLAIMPCTDAMSIAVGSNAHISESALHEHSDHNHSEEEDSCTSFCNCQCCGISITAPISASFSTHRMILNCDFTHQYSFDYYFVYSSDEWRPPALLNAPL